MALASYLTNRSFVLKALLLLLGAFYFVAGALPKFGDYWVITNISRAFAVDPLHFMAGTYGIAFPPTFYALQVAWLISFSLRPNKFHAVLIPPGEPRHLPFLGHDTNIGGAFPLRGDSIQGA